LHRVLRPLQRRRYTGKRAARAEAYILLASRFERLIGFVDWLRARLFLDFNFGIADLAD